MIKMIAAVSQNGVIGKNNELPWHHPEEMAHFHNMTEGKIVVMGRKTFESMGSKPLPNRTNVIVSSTFTNDYVPVGRTRYYKSIVEAIAGYATFVQSATPADKWLIVAKDEWFIGGASIYQEGMDYASEIWLSIVPMVVEGSEVVRFPFVDPSQFVVEQMGKHSEVCPVCWGIKDPDPNLLLVKYVRV